MREFGARMSLSPQSDQLKEENNAAQMLTAGVQLGPGIETDTALFVGVIGFNQRLESDRLNRNILLAFNTFFSAVVHASVKVDQRFNGTAFELSGG
jgi:hypothetical protein